MQRSKIVIGAFALLLAAGSAFATSKTFVLTPYFYYDSAGKCQTDDLAKECDEPGNTCREDIGGVSNNQLFASGVVDGDCFDPLAEN